MQINFIQASASEKQFVQDLLGSARYRTGYSGPETVEAMREASARMAATELATRIPAGTSIEATTIEGVTCERITPPSQTQSENKRSQQVVLYLHGGGFVRGSLDLGRSGAAQLAAGSGRPVLAIGYRQGPEYRVPAASEDLLRVYSSLLDGGYRPEDVVIVGESAGGTLALALPAWLKDDSRPAPAGLVGLSPMADLRMRGASWYFNAERDFATVPMGRRMLAHYAEDSELNDPRINPVVGPVEGHNSILLCVGSHETMLSDVEWYAHMAETAENEVTLNLYESMPHGFTRFDLPIARQTFLDVAAWCVKRFGRS